MAKHAARGQKLRVFDILVEETVAHTFKVKAVDEASAKAAAEDAMDSRQYGAQYVVENGVPQRTKYIVKVSDDQLAKTVNDGDDEED